MSQISSRYHAHSLKVTNIICLFAGQQFSTSFIDVVAFPTIHSFTLTCSASKRSIYSSKREMRDINDWAATVPVPILILFVTRYHIRPHDLSVEESGNHIAPKTRFSSVCDFCNELFFSERGLLALSQPSTQGSRVFLFRFLPLEDCRIGGFRGGAEGAAGPLFFLYLQNVLWFCFENRFINSF